MSRVDISGLSKGEVLAALFNASAPQGLGFLQAGSAPKTMTAADAEQHINRDHMQVDYVAGRPIKVDLAEDAFEAWSYDRDNGGEGAAQRVINKLRESHNVNPAESQQAHDALLKEKAKQANELAGTPSTLNGNVLTLGVDGELGEALKAAVSAEQKRA